MEKQIIQQKISSYMEASVSSISDYTNSTGERLYTTPEGQKYPSVTTVISTMSDKSWLVEWQNRVGIDEAARITKEATHLGSNMHQLIEWQLTNQTELIDNKNVAYQLYRSLSIFIRKVEAISVELPLYSDNMKVAGRTDCIGYYSGVLSIIDFKSARREKRAEDIESYFIQCCFYAMMLFELTGINCTDIVILIAVRNGLPQIFKRKINVQYIKKCIKMAKDYHNFNPRRIT